MTRELRDELEERGLLAIAEACAAKFNVSLRAMLGPGRSPQEYRARSLFCGVLSRRGFSSVEIGALVQRDHSTVLHALSLVTVSAADEIERAVTGRAIQESIVEMRMQ